MSLHNSLIAYGGTNGNAYGTITDVGFNICSDGSANLNSGSSYNSTDPQLGPLADNGGPTLCMALLPDSPAIDFGDSSGAPATDQRGVVRPFGDGVDMGAYEYGPYQPFILYLNTAPTAGNVLLSFTASLPGSYRLQASTNLNKIVVGWIGFYRSSVWFGQPRVENVHKPEENHVSSVSSS